MNRRGSAGVALVLGMSVALPTGAFARMEATPAFDGCTRTVDPSWSVARVWDEAILDAIRRDFPAPTVHARNLFHLSAGMYDAWAAFDPIADGYFVAEDHAATDVQAAREEAMSFAAYRILRHRYATSMNAAETLAQLDATMTALCYPVNVTATAGDRPAELGNRIAATILAFGLTDGSNEEEGYRSPDYVPVNLPLIVNRPEIEMVDPNRWQPLALEFQETQNGQALPDAVQSVVTPHWGHVASFGLMANPAGLPLDPGAPPRLGDPETEAAWKATAVDIIRRSAALDPSDGVLVDISPASTGDNRLGLDDGTGYSVNPATGEPYAPQLVPLADHARALSEYWADGPKSETPPGHWNKIANQVADTPGFAHRIGGQGPLVDRLEWDVKTYFALNGALHDAAVAAWGAKGHYDTARPISMIRYMASKGQSTNRRLPSYHAEGLPLVKGLIEAVTRESSRPGRRHEALREHVGEVAIKAWRGNPADPETETAGVGWILATTWVPYMKPTFVSPAFPGYVSGHSTFSRAAAEVLTSLTGSAFFPGGLWEWAVAPGALEVEAGPSVEIRLQAATYYDAADQAGISRLWGGIHPGIDDGPGRLTGSQCGKIAWSLAQTYFMGSARA